MTNLRRMGLDPGCQLGWAVIEYAKAGEVDLVASGTLDARPPGGSLHEVRCELASVIGVAPLAGIGVEELLESKGAAPTHCPKLAYWVEGIVHDLLSEPGYPPVRYYDYAQVRRYLGCRDKAQVRKLAEAVIGKELRGKPDHESDAIGIAVADMIGQAQIFPRLKWDIELTVRQAKMLSNRPSAVIHRSGGVEVVDLRNDPKAREELMRALDKGTARLSPIRRR